MLNPDKDSEEGWIVSYIFGRNVVELELVKKCGRRLTL